MQQRKRFNIWHSILGCAALLAAECVALAFMPAGFVSAELICIVSLLGGAAIIVVSTEVIEEVRNATHMLGLLSAVVFEFIVFFAFQYFFFLAAFPMSFQSLQSDPVSLLLHSTMIFVFNPLYVPTTLWGRALLFINTLGSLVLAFFVLQNVWQFRTRTFESK